MAILPVSRPCLALDSVFVPNVCAGLPRNVFIYFVARRRYDVSATTARATLTTRRQRQRDGESTSTRWHRRRLDDTTLTGRLLNGNAMWRNIVATMERRRNSKATARLHDYKANGM